MKKGRKSLGATKKPIGVGKRGPAKKPSAVLKKRGTFRRDRHSDDLEPATPPNLPAAPQHLTDAERAKWHEVGSKLVALGICSDLDGIALELLVTSYCGMVEATQELAHADLVVEVGESGCPMANPLVGIVGKRQQMLKWCLTQFGMTASSRTSIRLPEPQKIDPMQALLAQR